MHAGLAAGDDVGGHERRKIFQPEAGGFGFTVAKLPWLDDLVGLADFAGNGADWVFEGDVFDRSREKEADKVERGGLEAWRLGGPLARSTDGEVRAGWVRDHYVPRIGLGDEVANICLEVKFRGVVSGEQVA